MNQKYTKNEHLKGEKQIKYLFEKGLWASKFPLKIIYTPQLQPDNLHKAGVSVSKRNFKHSVDRNYIKRLLRECYRLNKNKIYTLFPQAHLLMIIYTGKDKPTFKELEKNYIKLLEKISSLNKN
ncbi:ribonuclease P protein component [Apibacter raozihei]|uniref:ribonuclease P protein component n=1 Tax=Apibacter TaxID=1778601 RepID=UPI000FE37CC6|nr:MULTISPECIES: ribonuclease P protein component [Apibacter]